MRKTDIQNSNELKSFLISLYEPILTKLGDNYIISDKDNKYEYIHICKFYDRDGMNIPTAQAFNNINDLVEYALRKSFSCNTYFTLATNDGEGKRTENLKTRTFLAFDFDKKELGDSFNHIDIMNRFRDLNLYYNAIVSSGNGYHVYICIEPTTDIDLVEQLQKAIAKLVGADMKATLKTQILRVPNTYNCKDKDNLKKVNIIYLDTDIKRKSLKKLSKKFLTVKNQNEIEMELDKNINYSSDTIPTCINTILKKGSGEGDRHNDLYKIVCTLRDKNNFSLERIKALCNEYNLKNQPPIADAELNYQIEYTYNNGYKHKLMCNTCKLDCSLKELNKDIKDEEINFKHTVLKKCAKKGAKNKMVNGNEIIIYGLLFIQGVSTQDKLLRELKHNNKYAMSERTLKSCLKEMEENKIIEVSKIDRVNYYSLKNRDKIVDSQKIVISSSMIYECIKENITQAELQFYCFLNYLQYQQRASKKTKGNFKLKITHEEIATEYGITREHCTMLMNKLQANKYISIYETHKSKTNGYDYYTYTINY